MPVSRRATTGSPAARASSAAIPNDSSTLTSTKTSARAKDSRIAGRVRQPVNSTAAAMPSRCASVSIRRRSGPSPITVSRTRRIPRSRATTAATTRSSAMPRSRACRRSTDTRRNSSGVPGTGEVAQAAGSSPLGSTSTVRAGASQDTSRANAPDTAEKTCGQRLQPSAPSQARSRWRCTPSTEWNVTTIGSPSQSAAQAPASAAVEQTLAWMWTTSGASVSRRPRSAGPARGESVIPNRGSRGRSSR